MGFNTGRYISHGVECTIPIATQLKIWGLIEMIPVPVDYIQFFRLQSGDGVQTITHEQEEPVYSKTISFPCSQPVTAKIYVIDSIDYCTMLLAEEY